jgi:pyruvate formate lyase activating enzyme
VGCNLHCRNCQNHSISQANPWDDGVQVLSARPGANGITPDELVALARQNQCLSIAATYTEPLVFYEYTRDTGQKARAAGLRYVMVTAGYLNPGPLRELCRVVDASNVDIKTMRPAAFRRNSGGVLRHVLDGLVVAREAGVWLEITSLIIPTFNDSPAELRELSRWVVRELGPQTPIHFSRFHPDHQLRNLPPTPPATLLRAREIALEEGLRFPYIGNLRGAGGEDTRCPGCGAIVIERVGFHVRRLDLVNGRCGRCQRPLEGIWS